MIPLALKKKNIEILPYRSSFEAMFFGGIWTKKIEENVKSYGGCAIATKVPPLKFTPWPNIDRPWSRLHIDFAGSMKGQHYLIVTDSFSNQPEVMK